MKKFMDAAAKRRARNYLAPLWLGGFKAAILRGWRGGWPPELLFIVVVVLSFSLPLPETPAESKATTLLLVLLPYSAVWAVASLFLWRSANQNRHKLWRMVFKLYAATMLFIAILMVSLIGMMGISLVL